MRAPWKKKIYVVFLHVSNFSILFMGRSIHHAAAGIHSRNWLWKSFGFYCGGVTRKTGAHTTYNANARGDVFRTARHNKFKINARPQMENIDKQPLRPGCREGEIYAFKSRHFFGNHQTKNINTGPRRKSILITTSKI
jgi:hypothetical protein